MVLEVKIVVYLWVCEGAWVVAASRGLEKFCVLI